MIIEEKLSRRGIVVRLLLIVFARECNRYINVSSTFFLFKKYICLNNSIVENKRLNDAIFA